MNWQHGQFESTAELAKDGSGYHVLSVQQGRRHFGWYAWARDRHYTSNKQSHCLDDLYDGPSKDAAIEACEAHRQQRRDDDRKSNLAEYLDEYVPTTEDFQHVE